MRTLAVPLMILFLFSSSASGQQRPQYTQYIFNNYLLNPALSGIENYTDVRVGSRKQWVGLKDAPFTSFFSVNMPIGRQYLYGNSNSFAGVGNNPMARSFMQNYMAAEPHHGIGISAVFDKTGPITNTDIKASYAYHLGLSAQMNLSVGVAAGISRPALDVSRLSFETNPDPVINQDFKGKMQPDIDVGVWLYGPDYFAGVSVQQLLGSPSGFVDASYAGGPGKQVAHVFATTGYKFFLNEEVSAVPSVMFKYVPAVPVSFDINLKLAFKDKIWIGASYRDKDAVAGMAGFNLGSLFILSYAYDFTTSEFGSVSNGSHELVLGILLNNRYRVSCPQRNW